MEYTQAIRSSPEAFSTHTYFNFHSVIRFSFAVQVPVPSVPPPPATDTQPLREVVPDVIIKHIAAPIAFNGFVDIKQRFV